MKNFSHVVKYNRYRENNKGQGLVEIFLSSEKSRWLRGLKEEFRTHPDNAKVLFRFKKHLSVTRKRGT
ncbi:hypothetical protein EFR34_09370 [Lactobacillus delbrueckii subsp. lactis]|nr:hypothetical protein [Lactobacillus delbrueckii subsp. lactis]